MLEILLNVLGVFLLTVSGIYIWSFLVNKKIEFSDYKFYIFTLILFFISLINYNNLLKFTIMTFFMIFFVKFVFKVNFKRSLLTVFCTQTMNVILELVFSIIAIFIFKLDFEAKEVSIWIILAADLFISIGSVLIFKLKFFKSLYENLIKFINKITTKNLLVTLLPIIFVFNIYLELTYYKIEFFYAFLLNNISIYSIVAIILLLAKNEKEYNKIYDKYNSTLNSLKEYEDILDKYRVSNHENKNQLLTIRNMIFDKNKKALEYIDEIVKNKLKDDERIMQEVSIIPAGGFRGLIYSKILYMKEKSIQYELNVSKDLRTVDLISKLDDSDMLDICQIIGVYIDNAIEEVLKIKDKYVNIDMYLENNSLVFEVSNYYEGKIELEKLEEKGYTTKGSGHGYGLSLTKEIINNNKKLKNEKRLSKETFTQVLKIKM